jgi:hypothetical protein
VNSAAGRLTSAIWAPPSSTLRSTESLLSAASSETWSTASTREMLPLEPPPSKRVARRLTPAPVKGARAKVPLGPEMLS